MDNNEQQQQQDEERRRQEEAAYADAMIKRDKEKPRWLREHLTGARDPDINHYRGR